MRDVIPKHLEATTAKLEEIGCEVEEFDDAVRVRAGKSLRRTNVKTLPYPGYPTDMAADRRYSGAGRGNKYCNGRFLKTALNMLTSFPEWEPILRWKEIQQLLTV